MLPIKAFFVVGVLGTLSAAWAAEAPPEAPIMPTAPGDATKGEGIDIVLEQGKSLYYSGEYLPALDKFMKVLRRNPQQAEARQYVSRIVDQIRIKKAQE